MSGETPGPSPEDMGMKPEEMGVVEKEKQPEVPVEKAKNWVDKTKEFFTRKIETVDTTVVSTMAGALALSVGVQTGSLETAVAGMGITALIAIPSAIKMTGRLIKEQITGISASEEKASVLFR